MAQEDNLLFLLRQTEHIDQAIKTIDQLQHKQNSTLKTGNVVMIVCGEAVTTLTTSSAQKWVTNIKKYPNVSIQACGLSLDKFNKTREQLLQGVEYTANGFIQAFELQKKGYLSVEL